VETLQKGRTGSGSIVKDVSFATRCRWSIKWGLACSCIFESAFSNNESVCVRTNGSSSRLSSSSAGVREWWPCRTPSSGDFKSLCFEHQIYFDPSRAAPSTCTHSTPFTQVVGAARYDINHNDHRDNFSGQHCHIRETGSFRNRAGWVWTFRRKGRALPLDHPTWSTRRHHFHAHVRNSSEKVCKCRRRSRQASTRRRLSFDPS